MIKKCIPNKVILWGNDNYNTLGVLRMLSKCNIDIFFLINNKKRHCASKSRYLKKYYVVKSIEAGIKYLIDNFKEESCKSILICTSDLIAEAIDNNKEKLSQFLFISGVSEGLRLEDILDKNTMTSLAKECGLNVPYSRRITKNEYSTDIQFPCIVKPNKNRVNHKKEFKSFICNNPDELNDIMIKVNDDSEFILQQYIKKKYEILIYGCRLKNGDVFIPGCFLKDRWLHGGDATHGLITKKIPTIINIKAIEIFLKRIGYHGLFSVEFGVENDKAYFYEFNLRNDGTSHYFFPAGVNLPYLYVLDCIGTKYNTEDFKVKKDVFFIDEIGDKTNIDGLSLSKKQWKEDLKKCLAFKLYDKHDPCPYYWAFAFNNIYTNAIKKMIKNLLLLLTKKKWENQI